MKAEKELAKEFFKFNKSFLKVFEKLFDKCSSKPNLPEIGIPIIIPMNYGEKEKDE